MTDILSKARTTIDGDREDDYGDKVESFTRIGVIWGQLLHLPEPIAPRQVSIMMAGLKLSRLSTSLDHEDSWVDAAGYLAIGAELPFEAEANAPLDGGTKSLSKLADLVDSELIRRHNEMLDPLEVIREADEKAAAAAESVSASDAVVAEKLMETPFSRVRRFHFPKGSFVATMSTSPEELARVVLAGDVNTAEPPSAYVGRSALPNEWGAACYEVLAAFDEGKISAAMRDESIALAVTESRARPHHTVRTEISFGLVTFDAQPKVVGA